MSHYRICRVLCRFELALKGHGFTKLKTQSKRASGAKALTEKKGFIAALKALRHPKSSASTT
jgi:hypothetical protein